MSTIWRIETSLIGTTHVFAVLNSIWDPQLNFVLVTRGPRYDHQFCFELQNSMPTRPMEAVFLSSKWTLISVL